MKKILNTLLLSIALAGCTPVEFSTTSPSETKADKILALGLTHDENIAEARKITDPNMASVVVKELNNRVLEANNAQMKLQNISKYAESVEVSDGNSNYKGVVISDSEMRGFMGEYDYGDYFLKGFKDSNNNLIKHQLNFSITYTSDEIRNYNSASFCDKWQGCENEEMVDIILLSSKASDCSYSSCVYNEVMELKLSDDFLRKNMEEGFSVAFNSKRFSNKAIVTSAYIKGYLLVAN